MIKNLTRLNPPKIAWREIKNRILSKKYDLSLVFTGHKKMAGLNRKYRGKNRPTNVLAFGLDKNSGEIFLNLPLLKREAEDLKKTPRGHALYLYIHALLHLKGFKHNDAKKLKIMNKAEQKWLKILS